MKKHLVAILACLMLLSLMASAYTEEAPDAALIPAELSEADIVGSWRLTSLTMNDTRLAAESIGIELTVDFREDHTVRGTFSGNLGDSGQAEETWALDVERALILVSDSPYLKVRQEDGVLFLLMDAEIAPEAGGEMVFTRAAE